MSENGWKTILFETWINRRALGIRNVKELTDSLRTQSAEIRDVIEQALSGFLFHIVVNKVRRRQEIKVGLGVKSICMKYFGLDAHYAGYIEHDELVSRSINKRQPYLQAHSGSRCSSQIEIVAENLLDQKAL
jgi:MinD-like ATPase involved in chromosome partitioning or flagellar assembly